MCLSVVFVLIGSFCDIINKSERISSSSFKSADPVSRWQPELFEMCSHIWSNVPGTWKLLATLKDEL